MKKLEIFLNRLLKFQLNNKEINKYFFDVLTIFILTISIFRFNLELNYVSKFFFKYFNYKVNIVYYIFFIPFLYFIIDIIKNKRIKLNIHDIFLLIYLLFCIISTILSSAKYNAIFGVAGRKEGIIVIISYIMMYFNCKNLSKEYLKKLIKLLCYVIILQNVLAICQSFGNFISRWGHMANGLSGNPNFFGSFNCMFSLVFLSLYLFVKKDKLYLITSILSYVGLLLAESSGPFFSFCLVLFIIILYMIINKIKLYDIIIMLFIFVTFFPIIQIGNVYVNNEFYNNKIKFPLIYSDIEYLAKRGLKNYIGSQIDDKKDKYDISTGRMWIWKGGIELFKEHPYFGTGLDTFEVYSDDLEYKADKAHNNYLEILVCTGIFSLISYLGFIITLIIKTIKTKNILAYSFLFGFIAYSIQIAMNISTILVAPYYYILAGIISNLILNKIKL